ncbi:MAG: hypothetical protein MJ145_04575 [Clostridia bacterium]|nr:hypothetical protein [Clostridia bacterium]
MKRILITGGPTNEPIDEVMKITNMSTGSLSTGLARLFLKAGYKVTLVLNQGVKMEDDVNLKLVKVETTDEMLSALKEESDKQDLEGKYDCLIHAAAVGDYKADFSFLLEDMAEEIYEQFDNIKSAQDILAIMENPKCKVNDDTKISSYQKNLTVKLGLTPKIISNLRAWFKDSLLIGCKLLENVSKDELFAVATRLANKNYMDYILANDLADLRKGLPARYLIDKDGFTNITLPETRDIFNFVHEKVNQ